MMRYNQRMCEQNTQNMEETMSSVRRVYVEKKPDFAVQAKDLKHEIHSYLGISEVTGVRVLIRYDVEHISDEVFEKACRTVFSEPPVDTLYRESFKTGPSDRVFSVEFLPGQFDQRADSAVQCVKFLKEDEEPIIKSATTYVIEGNITDEQFEAIKNHCINPVDSRETGMEKPETLETHFDEPEDVKIFDGFQDMPEEELKKLYDSLNLAMTFKDFLHIQNYYKNEEKRNPSVTEIRVLDTYWSDHCRHTTFSTELKNVTFGDGDYRKPMEATYEEYLKDHKEIFKGRDDKFVCLMDLALMAMRKLKKEGRLEDQEESDECFLCIYLGLRGNRSVYQISNFIFPVDLRSFYIIKRELMQLCCSTVRECQLDRVFRSQNLVGICFFRSVGSDCLCCIIVKNTFFICGKNITVFHHVFGEFALRTILDRHAGNFLSGCIFQRHVVNVFAFCLFANRFQFRFCRGFGSRFSFFCGSSSDRCCCSFFSCRFTGRRLLLTAPSQKYTCCQKCGKPCHVSFLHFSSPFPSCGNTAQRLCDRCVVKFFVKSRQTLFVRYYLVFS